MGPKNNEAAAVRGQLAVQYIDEILEKEPADKFYENLRGINEADILRGYKDNPDALKKMGAQIPGHLLSIIQKDEYFSQNPDFKFLIAGDKRTLGNAEELTQSLQDISEKGFAAGFGGELVVDKAKKYLDQNRETVNRKYDRLQKDIRIQKEFQAIKSEYELVSKMDNRYIPESKYGISSNDLLKIAQDKALGKDVPPLVCETERSSGLKKCL